MLIAAKNISQLDPYPSTAQYVIDWALFTLVALLPLGVARLMPLLMPDSRRRASSSPAGGSNGMPARLLPSSSSRECALPRAAPG
jgi:hypothetical protein